MSCLQDGRLELKQGVPVDHEASLSNTACQCVFLCLHVWCDAYHVSMAVCESLVVSLIFSWCVWFFSRSEGGVFCAARVCDGGGRARARRTAVPANLHNGVAASVHWLPRPGGSESCVSQPAGCSTRQPPQCCPAL